MVAITYDFLKKLEQAGFTPVQVEALSSFADQTANRPEVVQMEKDLTEQIERSETRLEKRIDKLEEKVDKRINLLEEKVDKRITDLEVKVDKRFDTLYSFMKWSAPIAITMLSGVIVFTGWLFHLSQ